ncbi:MAG: hypothetical protein OXU36_16305 [Candidatus Poribacteria bacterium]|nr:hypothetical protein [Candidatus Poribacteria bacterium]
MPLQLNWIDRDSNGNLYSLSTVPLADQYFDNLAGIYIIYYLKDGFVYTVYVGQGVIKDRLYAHRNDDRIQAYNSHALYTAWANTSVQNWDGIEKHLHDRLHPLVGVLSPNALPISTNLPGVYQQ